jgi:SNF2 family DNA or RNA helicase
VALGRASGSRPRRRRSAVRYAKKIHGVREDREEAFDKHLKPYMVRRTKAEVIKELPPKQYVDLWCEMTPTQKKQYIEFAINAELKIEEENLTATGILAEYMRLKQFAGARQEAGKVPRRHQAHAHHDSGKLPHVLRILNERGIDTGDEEWGDEQVVIFSQFRGMVDMTTKWLNEKCGIRAEKITGETKQSERDSLVKEFQAGEFRVMVVSTTAGGVASRWTGPARASSWTRPGTRTTRSRRRTAFTACPAWTIRSSSSTCARRTRSRRRSRRWSRARGSPTRRSWICDAWD